MSWDYLLGLTTEFTEDTEVKKREAMKIKS